MTPRREDRPLLPCLCCSSVLGLRLLPSSHSPLSRLVFTRDRGISFEIRDYF